MQKLQKNIVFLALFHVALIVSPILVKALHHHDFKVHHHFSNSETPTISSPDSHCLICEFQFVSVVRPDVVSVQVEFSRIYIATPAEVTPEVQNVYRLSYLRGPPVC